MSVEKNGIKGYEYQYLVTVYLALQYLKEDFVEVYVETEEDAKIVYGKDKKRKELYIQVKKHDDTIDFSELNSWLFHFGGRQSSQFLLKELKNDNKHLLFVTTGRCEDRLIPYLYKVNADTDGFFGKDANDVQETVAYKQKKSVSSQDVLDIKKYPSTLNPKTKLDKDRIYELQNYFKVTTDSQIRAMLEKVKIIEQKSCKNILELISSLLNTRFAIKSRDISLVIDLLDHCVREGRDSGNDIAAAMKEKLLQYTQRLLPSDLKYLELPLHQKYNELLENQNVLLFTGLPFCGKTIAAQAIAQGYAVKGFEIFQTCDINEGLAFLNNYTDSKKLLLLEDPFGSIQVSKDRCDQVIKLKRLVFDKSSICCKLIVTTRKDILFSAFDKKELEACSIGGHIWNDLTMSNAEFAQKTWCTAYGNDDKSRECFKKISDYIKRNEQGVFLEIGEIFSLKRSFSKTEDLLCQSNKDILRNARISSESVVDKLRSEGDKIVKIFLALGFICNTIREASFRELAYVLSDADEQPSLLPDDNGSKIVIVIGGKRETPKVEYPNYSQDYCLSKEEEQILIRFEQYGFIFIDRRIQKLRFQHPVFCYAAKLLLIKELNVALNCNNYVMTGRRAIGAIDKSVNLCALDFLYTGAEDNNEHKEAMRSVIFQALDSRYPAVRDRAILFLETNFLNLQTDQQRQLLDAVKTIKLNYNILWDNGEPMFNPEKYIDYSSEYIFPYMDKPPMTLDEICAVKTKTEISPKQMYDIMQSDLRNDLPLDFLNIALDFDESIIREKAAHLLFKNYAGLFDLSNYLNEFDSFNVVCMMFQGALESWFNYSEDDRKKLQNYFVNQLGRLSVSIQIKDFLENFADEYQDQGLSWSNFTESEKAQLWELWCVLFTEFFKQFKVDFLNMNQYHMEASVNKMAEYVNDPKILEQLFYAWNEWLTKVSCTDDYSMCLAEKVLMHLPSNHDRFKLLSLMLQAEDTSVITSHMCHIADCWSSLTDKEREVVKRLLATSREDLKWIKAVVLTREQVPDELQTLILNGRSTSGNIELLEALRTEGLLEQCLNVYCGYPQPLWANGYHHSATKKWIELIAEELITDKNTCDRAFRVALREFVQCEYDYEYYFEQNNEKIWESMLLDPQKRIAVFEQLLQATVTINQTNKGIWERYFNCCEDTEIKQSCKKIADVIEAVEYHQDRGCFDLFSNDIINKYIYPLLTMDNMLKDLCLSIKQAILALEQMNEPIEEIACKFESIMLNIYHKNPPRMKRTSFIVRGIMKDLRITSNDINEQLEICRHTLIDYACSQAKEFEDEYPPENWIGK